MIGVRIRQYFELKTNNLSTLSKASKYRVVFFDNQNAIFHQGLNRFWEQKSREILTYRIFTFWINNFLTQTEIAKDHNSKLAKKTSDIWKS